jgi:hypothetical protein
MGSIQRIMDCQENIGEDFPTLLAEKRKKEFTLGIAGIGISFLFDQSLSELGVEHINDPFVADINEKIKLRVHYSHAPKMDRIEKIFDSGYTWAFYLSHGKYILQNRALESDLPPTIFVILEPGFKSGEIYIAHTQFEQNLPPDPLGHPLNQILMILLLSLGKGVLFHACGVADKDSGYLFLGNSGDGKSTMAKLWFDRSTTILNDDRIVVREKEGAFWMYGTPWHGDFKELSPKGLPIQKIFFLRRGKGNKVVLKNGAEAVAMFLARCFPPLWDNKGMAFTTDLCHHIVNEIPCYELRFVPDAGIVDFVRNV